VLLPVVYFIQTAVLEKVRGLNLNKCYPVKDTIPAVNEYDL
jgi:hypothetical protein